MGLLALVGPVDWRAHLVIRVRQVKQAHPAQKENQGREESQVHPKVSRGLAACEESQALTDRL